MTTEQKHDFWQHHIDGWHQSKQSQREYCKQQDLSFASFGYWRTRFNRKTETLSKFISVNVPSVSASVNVFLPVGLRLEIPAHALADLLPAIVRSVQDAT